MKDSLREFLFMEQLEKMVDRHKEFWKRSDDNNDNPTTIMYQRGLFEGFYNAYLIANEYLIEGEDDGNTPEDPGNSEGN